MNGKIQFRFIVVVCLLAFFAVLLSATQPLAAEANAFNLALTVSPPGSGTAVANPGPPYSENQVVTLTATPASGYMFDQWVLVDGSKWWDSGWDYRVGVTAGAAGYARKDKPAEFDINFTQLWSSMGVTGTLDPNSIRVVEVDANNNVLDAGVPFQFDKATDYNASTKAAGTLVVIMKGNTAAGSTRTYHVYFDVTGKSFPAPSVTPQVVFTEQPDEGIASFKFQTSNGTMYIHKSSGGVSSYNDVSGNDWVSWNSAAGASGGNRGIPNAAGGSNEAIFHPGKGKMTPTIVNQGPIKVTLHFLGQKISGDLKRWEGTFEIYPHYTTFTMLQARVSSALAYPFWFLYEGTPGGQLNPTIDFLVFSNGQQINAGQTRDGDLPGEEWAYVADPNVGTGRSIFLINHKDDNENDTYFPDNSKVMTILGFGRSGSALLMDNNTAPRSFTFGLMDETLIDNAKPVIYNAYRELITTVGNAESNSGVSLGKQNPVQFTITGEHTIVAQFKPAQYTFNATSPGNGTVDWTPKKASYTAGEQITVTAAPASGFVFGGWSGDLTSTANPLVFNITANTSIVANFVEPQLHALSISVPDGGGSVTKSPDQASYVTGTVVTLTAVPDTGKQFIEWGGDASGSDPVTQITMTKDMIVTAAFADDGEPLAITISPPEGGNVSRFPDQAFYLPGTEVTLTALPSAGWTFQGWSGDATGTNSTTVVTIGDDGAAVTATFSAPQAVTLTTSTTGNGTITINPQKTEYAFGEMVKLTAVPGSGSIFAGWSGDATGTNNPINLAMNGDKNIIANFIVPVGPFTDQFDTCSLDAKWGSPIDPAGDGTFKVDGTRLHITVPEGATHNLWTTGKDAPRVMQVADNTNFEYVVKFDSTVTQTAQMQGIIIEQDAQKFARFDFEYNEGLKAFAATIDGATSQKRISIDINPADAVYLRVMRVASRWFMHYSGNGVDWIEAGSFNNYILNVSKAGVFAGNVALNGQPAPAHTAIVDYFHNKTYGPLPDDQPLLQIATVGSGSVTTNVPIDQLVCGQTVVLTANPGLGATFSGWSGAVTGSQRTLSLLINGPKQVTATFTGAGTRYLLLPMITR